MLEKANLTAAERFQNLFAGKIVIAIEPDTGVKLVVSRGRRRRGSAPNYILCISATVAGCIGFVSARGRS